MKLLPSLLLVFLAAGCATVPGTNRRRFAPTMPLGQQLSLGEEAYDQALEGKRDVNSGPEYEAVQRIGHRIAGSQLLAELFPDHAEMFNWEFRLIDDPETVNAWVLPGGKCAVFTGLLPFAQDENGLAAVIGHEIAHAVAEHGAERMALNGYTQMGLELADQGLSSGGVESRGQIMSVLGLASNYGVALPFSRTHESEADELGVYFAADAGFDPRAAIGLWERMSAGSDGGPPEWLSTHPSGSTRIQRLSEVMPRAMKYYEASLASQ